MKNFLDYKVIKWEKETAMLAKNNNILVLILKKENYEENLVNAFKKINVVSVEDAKQNEFLMISGKEEALLALGESINEIGLSLTESLLSLSASFKQTKNSLIQFRGDLAEAIFLYKKGGKKMYKNLSADILLNDEMIEVKSVSPQKQTITISKQQLEEKTKKYAIYLYLSSEGLMITEIAKKIKNNAEFTKSLLEKYENTEFEKLKYKIAEPLNITSKTLNIKFPKEVIKATLEIKI